MGFIRLILFMLPFISLSFAQTKPGPSLQESKAFLESRLKQHQITTKLQEKILTQESQALKAKKEELNLTNNYDRDFKKSQIQILDEINGVIRDLPASQKFVTQKAFYKCLGQTLKEGQMKYEDCQKQHQINFDKNQSQRVLGWKKSVGYSPLGLEQARERLSKEIESQEKRLVDIRKGAENSKIYERSLKNDLEVNAREISEVPLISKFSRFIACNNETPEINLESKNPFPNAGFSGPFYGIPRDNQDGLGTCYANTAKNLLVGLSDGKDVASFLDIALHFKGDSNRIAIDGLEEGDVCGALESVQKRGYCPQNFAPIENGEANKFAEDLFNLDSYNFLATNVKLMKEFINDVEKYQNTEKSIDSNILMQARSIIEGMKNNPDIRFPLPLANIKIPSEWKLKEIYNANKHKTNVFLNDFMQEHDKAYDKFFPSYVKALLNKKSQTEIFEIYTKEMSGFHQKFQLVESLPTIRTSFVQSTTKDFSDPELRAQLRLSVDFLKSITAKNDVPDDPFVDYCFGAGNDSFQFVASLAPIVQKIRQQKLNMDKLFNPDGQLKSSVELLQLTVAPACINEGNRKKTPALSCSKRYDFISQVKTSSLPLEEKYRSFRQQIVLSLAQGSAVGNTFPYGTSQHINTIVGLRFNKDKQQCEYLIRESQNGTSIWQKEADIFNNVTAITEVRKK